MKLLYCLGGAAIFGTGVLVTALIMSKPEPELEYGRRDGEACSEWALRMIDSGDRGDLSYTKLHDTCTKDQVLGGVIPP